MDTCTQEFEHLARAVGGLRCNANPFVEFHDPFTLDNWTMPLIELTLVVGAVACLVHALRWRKAHGDAAPLVIWFSGIFCLLLIEPVAYFPQWWGLEDSMGLTFLHNQFSVQFLYGRLPLYIVAMYPAYGYVSYMLVQRTGIFERRHVLVGATCAALAFHVTYMFIDMIGPQWHWWVWATDVPSAKPAIGSSPYLNVQAFSIALPFAMTLLAQLTKRWSSRGNSGVVASVAVIAVGVWPIIFFSDVPWIVPDLLGMSTVDARRIGTWALIVAVATIGGRALFRAWNQRAIGSAGADPASQGDSFALRAVMIYLVVGLIIWVPALPDYFDAVAGIAPDGGQTGSLTYAIIMLVGSIAVLVGCYAHTLSPVGAADVTATAAAATD
ncbi:hypothetical protein [Nocardioides marmorisolisilvae]|uniref:hypothetical protein n=1 Tax=Nocardioides marmorisolisilvae TaxID=1542737 RepID=UPI0011CDB54D|nr:hypothetical protein [Nocardioides marmorisolisilvae]